MQYVYIDCDYSLHAIAHSKYYMIYIYNTKWSITTNRTSGAAAAAAEPTVRNGNLVYYAKAKQGIMNK